MTNPVKPALVIIGGFFYALLSSCSSLPLQSETLLQHRPDSLRESVELTQAPFNPQLEYQCGPSALATLLQHNGLNIQPESLTQEVYLPQKKGSLQIELIAATRRHNQLPYIIDEKMLALLTEVQAGNPVLVLQNLGLESFPQWHYAVVVGYDLTRNEIILRSGEYKRHINSFSLFEKTWQRADYWGMVVMPLNRLPATATPFRYLSAAVDFEKSGKLEQAKQAYHTGLQKWPGDKHLLMATGNIHYRFKNVSEAEKHYQRVINQWPEYAPALNNLAEIRYEQAQYHEAERLSRRAVESGGQFKAQYQATLEKILKARSK